MTRRCFMLKHIICCDFLLFVFTFESVNGTTKRSVSRGIVAKSIKHYYFMRRMCVRVRWCDDNIYPAISMNTVFIARERLTSFAHINKTRHGKSLHYLLYFASAIRNDLFEIAAQRKKTMSIASNVRYYNLCVCVCFLWNRAATK